MPRSGLSQALEWFHRPPRQTDRCIWAIKVVRGWYVRSSVAETFCATLISVMLACLAWLLTSLLGEHHPPPHRVGDRLSSSSHTHALKQSSQLGVEYTFAHAQVAGDLVV